MLTPRVEAAFGERLQSLCRSVIAVVALHEETHRQVEAMWESYPRKHLFEGIPNLSPLLAARIFGEIGDNVYRFRSPEALARYAGFTPIVQESGKTKGTKVTKSYNHFLHQAVLGWARTAHNENGTVNVGMRAHVDYRLKVRGERGPRAYRNLGSRLIAGIWHCLATDTPWDNSKCWINQERHLEVLALMPKIKPVKGKENPEARKERYRTEAYRAGIVL